MFFCHYYVYSLWVISWQFPQNVTICSCHVMLFLPIKHLTLLHIVLLVLNL